ncbi:MAG: hypothetical protein MK200_04530 [Nitrosopumilus sp.]|nr:hypothetical protein [Nitrosopumilus sp.]
MIKSLEERIVNLTKVTTDNVQTTVEAELRQLKMEAGEPIQATVVLAKEDNFQFTMDWDSIISKFSTTLDGIEWYSDFDYSLYSPKLWETGNIARASRRGRNSPI